MVIITEWLVAVTDTATSAVRYSRKIENFRIEETLNDINTFSFTIPNSNSTDRANFDMMDEIDILRDGTSIFIGIIENVKYKTDGTMTVTGRDYAIKLFRRLMGQDMLYTNKNNGVVYVGWAGDQAITQPNSASTHLTFDSSSASDIQTATIKGLITSGGHNFFKKEEIVLKGTTSVNTVNDFSAVWTITLDGNAVGTLTVVDSLSNAVCTFSATESTAVHQDADNNYGNGILYSTGISVGTINAFAGNPITVQFDWDNKLRATATVANICAQDWWVDTSKQLQIRNQRGSSTPVAVLKDGINIQMTERERDGKNIFNRMVFLGKAEGINQTYSGVEDTTSQTSYGLSEGKSEDRRVTTSGTADDLLTAAIATSKDPVETYSVIPIKTTGFALGDVVRLVDDKVGLSSTYRIKRMTRNVRTNNETLSLDITNVKADLSNMMRSLKNQVDITNTSPQGAVNLLGLTMAENCDSSKYLNLRFYMPTEAKAVNRVKVNFKLENYRAYTGTTPSGGDDTSGANSAHPNENAHHTAYASRSITTSFADVDTQAISNDSELVMVWVQADITSVAWDGTQVYCLVNDGTTDYPSSTGIKMGKFKSGVLSGTTGAGSAHYHSHTHGPGGSGNYFIATGNSGDVSKRSVTESVLAHTHGPDTPATWDFLCWKDTASVYQGANTDSDATTENAHTHSILEDVSGAVYYACILVPGNMNTKTLHVKMKKASGANKTTDIGVDYHVIGRHTHTTPAHTHTMGYAITEDAASSPSVDLYAGAESSESQVGTYTTNQDNLDITAFIGSASGWKNIQFRPDQNLRIDATAFVQIYLESK